MEAAADIRRIFQERKRTEFDFSQAPAVITSKRGLVTAPLDADAGTAERWSRVQGAFVERIGKGEPSKTQIEQVRAQHAAFFAKRGNLRGNVLDIGGGWGLYREWWEGGEPDLFVVHDPGLDRFLKGAHPVHHECYQRAFTLPMTFVEGFGEDLCYNDGSFDTCLTAATLDHCADPPSVLAEAYRCLKPGGRMIVLQECHSPRARYMHILKRIVQHLHHPRKLFTRSYARLTAPPMHMHHFVVKRVATMMRETGFSQVRSYRVTEDRYWFEAVRIGP